MIPVCTPLLGKSERKYLNDCIDTNWISSSGKYIRQFEEKFSRYCGMKYGITTTSGTTALHLALVAAGIGKGDEVIMPTFNIASTAFAAIYCGAKPVFVDSEPVTWNMDPAKIEAKVTRRTKAIIPVHIYGHPCAMRAVMRIARKHKLLVIEDAAEAHGAEYYGQKAGGIGDISCFSFYGNKAITTGEGGMVLTNSKKIDERCRRLKNLDFQSSRRFWHEEVGFNYRMTNMQAAVGLAQFEQIDRLVEKRRRNAMLYNSLLKKVQGLTLPDELPNIKNSYWMYGILVGKDFGMSRETLMKKLKDRDIETRTFFIPMHRQPVLEKLKLIPKDTFPVADDISERGLYLPSGSGLKKKEIEYVCDCIRTLRRSA